MPPYILEVCVDSLEGALAAEAGGADRIELCSCLSEGGLTPSHALVHMVCRKLRSSFCRVHVLVRPRGGDFLYSEGEVAMMREEVLHAASAGAHGIVVGFLTPKGDVDVNRTVYFVQLTRALGLDLTFHRAFDVVRNQVQALSDLIDCGVGRILTSGGEFSAIKGLSRLAMLHSMSESRCSIMPGGGVTEDNVETILKCTGVREIHGTFRRVKPSNMRYFHPEVVFGPPGAGEQPGEGNSWDIWVADVALIRQIKSRLSGKDGDDDQSNME